MTNFNAHIKYFAEHFNIVIGDTFEAAMPTCTARDVTIINFGIGSSVAATIIDLLSTVSPKFVVFIGKCAGLEHQLKVGDFFLPVAAVRGEGTSNDYYPPEIPALPNFAAQRILGGVMLRRKLDYHSGIVYTTNRRVWEHDEHFKTYLKKARASCLEMELATLFTTSLYNDISIGALLAISDVPLVPTGVGFKSKADDRVEREKRTIETMVDIALDAIEDARKKEWRGKIDAHPYFEKNVF